MMIYMNYMNDIFTDSIKLKDKLVSKNIELSNDNLYKYREWWPIIKIIR